MLVLVASVSAARIGNSSWGGTEEEFLNQTNQRIWMTDQTEKTQFSHSPN
jgi:hypothetical protein